MKYLAIAIGSILIGAVSTYDRNDLDEAVVYLFLALVGMFLLMYGMGL